MEVDLGPGHIVLDGDPALSSSSPKKGTAPKFSAHVYCAQTAGCIKMPLGVEVGLDPSNIVLDGDPAPPPQKGQSHPIFGPCLLYPNGCMDHDATWYGCRPRPRPRCASLLWPNGWMDQNATYNGRPRPGQHCVKCGPSSTPKGHSPPNFGPCMLRPNGWMDQDATWYDGRPRPGQHCVRCGPSFTPKGHSPRIFAPCILWPNGCPYQLLLSTCL